MKIEKVTVKNFKGLGPKAVTFAWKDITVLIGENNVGKSSILAALGIYFSGTKTIDRSLYYKNQSDESNAIEITCVFSALTDLDKAHKAVTSNTYDDRWTLRKKYWWSETESDFKYSVKTGSTETDWKENPGGAAPIADNLLIEPQSNLITIEAVKDASTEGSAGAKSAFGQLFKLMVEAALVEKQEVKDLSAAVSKVLALYEKDTSGNHAITEIADLERQLTEKLSRVISAKTTITAAPPKSIESVFPIPSLQVDDGYLTGIAGQGQGLQRSLILCLLELLASKKTNRQKYPGVGNILMIEEPEIYMHPQMQRKMADVLYDLAEKGEFQVLCTTHSPIFIRLDKSHRALVRVVKDANWEVTAIQTTNELFSGSDAEDKKKRMNMLYNFDPAVNEMFFARRVLLVEGKTERVSLEKAAELLGVFDENPERRRELTLVSCDSIDNIPAFVEVLNHFGIEYFVIYDKDVGKPTERVGKEIEVLAPGKAKGFPQDFEATLGYTASDRDKVSEALEQIETLHKSGKLKELIGEFISFAYGVTLP